LCVILTALVRLSVWVRIPDQGDRPFRANVTEDSGAT
jgi:hypothetical protein